MAVLNSFLKHTVAAAFAATVFLCPIAVSAQNSDVSVLMAQLRDADPVDAQRIAKEIQLEWDQSGSASADFLLKRGRDALRRGDTEAALDHLTALVDHAPMFAEGWVARAAAYFQADMYGPAVHDLEQALALNPTHFEAIIGLALIFEVIGRPHEAYEAYQQVKAIHPHHADVTEGLQRLEPLVKGQAL